MVQNSRKKSDVLCLVIQVFEFYLEYIMLNGERERRRRRRRKRKKRGEGWGEVRRERGKEKSREGGRKKEIKLFRTELCTMFCNYE